MSKSQVPMLELVARPTVLASSLFVIGCGPGGFASDGGFGDGGSSTADDEIGEPTTGMSEPDPSTDAGPDETSTDTDETETETGAADDWTDPETSDDGDEPEPIDADCTRVWTVLDDKQSHGHIGATPIGPGPSGAFVSVNPVIASQDAVNVDAWIRSWTPGGALIWEQQVSWGDHRDDPLALLSDELGDVYMAGRINANTFEDAMVAKLDGETGELLWTFLRGEAGGYASVAHNGAALVVAGTVGEFGDRWLELIAFEPDTGEILWTSEPNTATGIEARGLVVADGNVDVLVASNPGSLEILRYQPPAASSTVLAALPSVGGSAVPYDLERLGDDRLAAVYGVGSDSLVAVVDRASGELIDERKLDDFPTATTVIASELVELPGGSGLGIAGTLEVGSEEQTFVLRLDSTLAPICSGVLSKADLGVSRSPLLRGLVVGDDGALYTGSFVDTPVRFGAFARWD